jgi:hypothetical protein
VTNIQKCACKGEGGNVREDRDLQRCCQVVIKGVTEWTIAAEPVMSTYRTVKQVIECEKREGDDCRKCTCERFKLKDSHEIVDENGEVAGTAESVICRCL